MSDQSSFANTYTHVLAVDADGDDNRRALSEAGLTLISLLFCSVGILLLFLGDICKFG